MHRAPQQLERRGWQEGCEPGCVLCGDKPFKLGAQRSARLWCGCKINLFDCVCLWVVSSKPVAGCDGCDCAIARSCTPCAAVRLWAGAAAHLARRAPLGSILEDHPTPQLRRRPAPAPATRGARAPAAHLVREMGEGVQRDAALLPSRQAGAMR